MEKIPVLVTTVTIGRSKIRLEEPLPAPPPRPGGQVVECPHCKTRLYVETVPSRRGDDELACYKCGCRFVVEDGIAVLREPMRERRDQRMKYA